MVANAEPESEREEEAVGEDVILLQKNTNLRNMAQVVLPSTKSGTISPSSHGTFLMCFMTGFFFCRQKNVIVRIKPNTVGAYSRTSLN